MKYILFLLVFLNSLNAMELGESLRLDGWGDIYTLSTTDEKQKSELNGVDTSGGVQARYQITDDFSATAQIYFYEDPKYKSNTNFDVEAKWLYIDYYLGYDAIFRVGIFQFPIFTSSETSFIGYTNTFTETPLTSYGANGYEDFTGAEVLKKYFYDDFEFLLQFSYGSSENDLPTRVDDGEINGKTNNLTGLTLKTTYEDFHFNMGYLQATTRLDGESEEIDFSTFAFESEINIHDYIVKAGYINTKLSKEFPDELRQYISLEHSIQDFTPYIYYSSENLSFEDLTNSAPPGQRTLTDILSEKYSVGVRYDFNANVAFKLSYINKIDTTKYEYGDSDKEKNDIAKVMINVIF